MKWLFEVENGRQPCDRLQNYNSTMALESQYCVFCLVIAYMRHRLYFPHAEHAQTDLVNLIFDHMRRAKFT